MGENSTLLIKNVPIYTAEGKIENGFVRMTDGVFSEVGEHEPSTSDGIEVLSLSDEYCVLPGFIDLHIHGSHGADTMDATISSLATMARNLPKEGTTSFLATTITQSIENIEEALENVSNYCTSVQQEAVAEILGVHLEGPFISTERAGAQPHSHIMTPNQTLFDKWQKMSGHRIKLVTTAPELENGMEFVRNLKNQGVVASVGHSDAKYEQVKEAIEQGVTHVTHLYNGMRGLHHREPGVVGAALTHEELLVEMIVDGIHIHPAVVKSTFLAKGASNLVLVTDAMRAKGLNDGTYDLGGQLVNVTDGKALLEDGTLAGSVLTMDQALRNMIEFTGCSLEDIVKMTSENPAKQLGVWNRKGSITVGKDADLTIIDKDLTVVMTICKGKVAYQRRNEHESN